ncbi:MAG: tail fiber domain-containing protein [Candidatus Zixiibacteriota bacterium]
MHRITVWAGALLAAVIIPAAAVAEVPASIAVQGRLTDTGGNPLPAGFKSFTFKIFDAAAGGTEIWPGSVGEEDQFLLTDADGLWSASVGKDNPLTPAVFADTVRWLEVTVFDGINPAVTLPRIRLQTSSYAFRVGSVDGASGGSITSQVSIGPGHSAPGVDAFVAGQNNAPTGNWSVIGGGTGNIAEDTGSVIGGGGNNHAWGRYSTIGGGGGSSPIDSNSASGDHATISGGLRNLATASVSSIGGGYSNKASNTSARVSGGSQNTASGSLSTVGGGFHNTAAGNYATAGGGWRNYALGDFATIPGGGGSTPADSNLATGEGTVIGGGSRNVASARYATVGGGLHNRARGAFATIGGGGGPFPSDSNSATGIAATVPGGEGNRANGNYSLAAGRRAKADHAGTFVWADSADADFASASPNQFLIRASNGVGIGTNAPEAPLHVLETSAGSVTANTNSIAVLERSTGGWLSFVSDDVSQRGILFSEPSLAIAGGIVFDVGGLDGLSFRTGGNTTRMTLDAAGDLTVTGDIVGATCCAPSDARFKTDIHELNNPLATLVQMRGVCYQWNRGAFPDRGFGDGEQIGLIAQEVEQAVPQAVHEMADGYLAVDYARLVPLLIESIKAQQLQIDELRRRLESAGR